MSDGYFGRRGGPARPGADSDPQGAVPRRTRRRQAGSSTSGRSPQQCWEAGLTKKESARYRPCDPRLVSKFFTKQKGAS